MENLATLFDCGNHFDPSTCRKDLFWRAIWNTAKFSVLQVTLMVLFSVITALVLNRKVHRPRLLARRVFLSRCCCRRSSSR